MLLLPALLLVSWDAASVWVADFTPVYPAVFVLGAVQCWRFHRSRLLFALVVVAIADRIMLHYVAGDAASEMLGRTTFTAVSILVPINLLVLSLLIERSPLSLRGLFTWLVIILQPALVARVLRSGNAVAASLLEFSVVGETYFAGTALPDLAILAFAATFLVLAVRLVLQPTAERRALLWALVAAFLAVKPGHAGLESTTYFAAAGLMIVVAVIDTSYRLAYHDALTGLLTRRGFNEALYRLEGLYTVAIVDIDHFKQCNDRYGHDVGDEVLRMVAATLEKVTGGAKAYRYGGEEFALLFVDKKAEDTVQHLQKLRSTVAGRVFTIRGPGRPSKRPEHSTTATGSPRKTINITVSFGAADNTFEREMPDDVVKAADQALYRAKETGRNKVVIRARPRLAH